MTKDDSTDARKKIAEKTNRPKRRWRRRLLVALVFLTLGYTLFGFFGVPLLIRYVGVPKLDERIEGTVALDRATFNPFTLGVVLEGLEIVDESGASALAFDRFAGNLQVLPTITRRGYHFRHALLNGAFLHVERDAEGELNLRRLWIPAADTPSEPLREIPRVVVADLAVTEASFVLRDAALAEPFEKEITKLNFSVTDLDTHPEAENAYRLEITFSEGETLAWEGSFFMDPLSSSGAVAVTDFHLPDFMPYLAPYTDGRLVDGRLSVLLEYDFAPLHVPREAALRIQSARLDDVAVELEDQRVLDLPGLEIVDALADAHTRALTVDRVSLPDAGLTVRRAENGRWQIRSLLHERLLEASEDIAEAEAPGEDEPIDLATVEYPVLRLLLAIQRLLDDAASSWDVSLGELELADANVELIDAAPADDVDLLLSALRISAGPIRSSEGYRIPISLACALQAGGTLTIDGALAAEKQEFTATVRADRLNLAPLAPYVPAKVSAELPPIRLASAFLSLDGSVRTTLLGDGGAESQWNGRLIVESLDVVSPELEPSLAKVDRLEVAGETTVVRDGQSVLALMWEGETSVAGWSADAPIDEGVVARATELGAEGRLTVDLAPDDEPAARYQGTARATGVQVDLPNRQALRASLERATVSGIAFDTADMSLSINELFVQSPALSAEAALLPAVESEDEGEGETDAEMAESDPPAASEPPIAVRVARLAVTGASLKVRDTAADPPVLIVAEDIDLEAVNLANDGQTVTELTLDSRVQNTGRMALRGRADPFRASPYADVELDVTALPLKPYDPYAGHFVGFLVESGRLTLNIPITVEEGELDGRLNAQLDRFHLGEKIDSPAAPDVPIKLGLDLMRDSNDRIDVGVGISGNINDPDFSLGAIIWDAFMNVLVKGATAPFQALASMFDGDETQDLSTLEFEPGTAQLTADALSKLDVLGEALTARPALRLTLSGVHDRTADAPAMQRAMLDEQLLAMVRQDAPAATMMTGEQRAATLERLYAERFPDRVRPAVPVPPGALDQSIITPEQMESALMESIEVPDDALAALADARVQRVIDALAAENGIADDRLSIADERTGDAADSGPRVALELF